MNVRYSTSEVREQVMKIKQLLEEGDSQREISAKIGLSDSIVSYRISTYLPHIKERRLRQHTPCSPPHSCFTCSRDDCNCSLPANTEEQHFRECGDDFYRELKPPVGYIQTAEFADRVGLDRHIASEMAQRSKLPCVRVKGRYYIPEEYVIIYKERKGLLNADS